MTDRQIQWQTGRYSVRQTGRYSVKYTDRCNGRQTDTVTRRHTQTDAVADKWIKSTTNRHTYRYSDRHFFVHLYSSTYPSVHSSRD